MRERLLATIRHKGLMRAGERVGVAVSGGADSVALLRLLLEARDELGVVLSVAHFNHKLRGEESEADEVFVRGLANEHGLEFYGGSGETRTYAAEHGCGIEAAAREMRYGFFWKLLAHTAATGGGRGPTTSGDFERSPGEGAGTYNPVKLDRIATAHTLEDQAETVIMRLARGAGTRGMAGIYPNLRAEKQGQLSIVDCRSEEDREENTGSLDSGAQRAFARDDKSSGTIVRPLLEFRRAQLRHYLRRAGQTWREDASNQDVAFARNRVRQEVMPKLRELNPAIEMVLGETAEIARAEEEYWREVVDQALGRVAIEKQGRVPIVDSQLEKTSAEVAEEQRSQSRDVSHDGNEGRTKAAIDIRGLLQLPLALRRRVVREFAERQGVKLEFHHVEQVLEVASGAPRRAVRRVELVETWDALVVEGRLRLEKRNEKKVLESYDLELPVPGEVLVGEAGIKIRARVTDSGPRLMMGELRVRNWRPGDRYWPAHTGSEKKLKELLQDRRVPAEARAWWPVVVRGEKIVWVPGFEYPEEGQVESGKGVALEVEKLNHF